MKGQSLFEVVLAIGLIGMILVSVVSLASLYVKTTNSSKVKSLASKFSQEGIEWIRSQRDQDWTTFASKSSAGTRIWCISDLTWPAGSSPWYCNHSGSWDYIPDPDNPALDSIYKREVFLTTLVAGTTIEAQVFVYWDDDSGYHEVRTSTILTRWKDQ